MTQLLLATRNAHKTREFAEILGDKFVVSDLSSVSAVPAIKETGSTFEENAILKSVTISQHRQSLVVGDDSGIEVEALKGAPGIFSARYAGANATDRQNIDKLLAELARLQLDVAQRTARFRCVLALARDGELLQTFEGSVEGKIVDVPCGSRGFGYDPIFVPEGFDQTFAELLRTTKNKISHRGRAIAAMREGFHARKFC